MRISGLTAVVLGVLFWTGNALTLLPIHMLAGFVLVLTLWILALLALRAGVRPDSSLQPVATSVNTRVERWLPAARLMRPPLGEARDQCGLQGSYAVSVRHNLP